MLEPVNPTLLTDGCDQRLGLDRESPLVDLPRLSGFGDRCLVTESELHAKTEQVGVSINQVCDQYRSLRCLSRDDRIRHRNRWKVLLVNLDP